MLNPLDILHIKKGHLEDPGWPIRKDMVNPSMQRMKTLRLLVPTVMSDSELKYAAVTMYEDYKTMPIQENQERVRLYINHWVRIRLEHAFYEDWAESLRTTTTTDVIDRLCELYQLYQRMQATRQLEMERFCVYARALLLDPSITVGYDTRPLTYYSSPYCGWVETHVLEPKPYDQDTALAIARLRVEEALCDYETLKEIEGCNGLPRNLPSLP